eukprot:COSAG02_NODE_67616_length_252_cov_1.013072_1_plen_56_part_10
MLLSVFALRHVDIGPINYLAALKESDGINNELTRQVDWREDVDWESIGHAPPTLEE